VAAPLVAAASAARAVLSMAARVPRSMKASMSRSLIGDPAVISKSATQRISLSESDPVYCQKA
jgi:hypothetical protein